MGNAGLTLRCSAPNQPCTLLSASRASVSALCPTLFFTEEETENQRGQGTRPRSHDQPVLKPEPRFPNSHQAPFLQRSPTHWTVGARLGGCPPQWSSDLQDSALLRQPLPPTGGRCWLGSSGVERS